MKMGLLDFGEIGPGMSRRAALKETLAFATLADLLGFNRYWLGEHHGSDCAWKQPETTVGEVLACTKQIRVGTGGILLNERDALEVVSSFSSLTTRFPGRIDLGIARGYSARSTSLKPSENSQYESKVATLQSHLSFGEGLHETKVSLDTTDIADPQIWVLGSGYTSMQLASSLGLPFVYSLFHSSVIEADILRRYEAEFRPSCTLAKPKHMIAVAGVCTNSAKETQDILANHANPFIFPNIVGELGVCIELMRDLLLKMETQDVMFLDIAKTPEQREASWKSLARIVNVL